MNFTCEHLIPLFNSCQWCHRTGGKGSGSYNMKTIERMILIALMRDMRKAGYEVAAVWTGDEYRMACPEGRVKNYAYDDNERGMPVAPSKIIRSLTDVEALKEIDSVDQSTLHFTHRNAKTWGNRGVLVILGNGEDVLSDFHATEREPFGKVIRNIYDKLNNGQAL